MNGIKHVRPGNGFEPNFLLSKKVDVNGNEEHPLFSFLKKSCPATRSSFASYSQLFYKPFRSRDIRWNFEKFLIYPQNGTVFKRYDPSTNPLEMSKDIEFLIQQKHYSSFSQFNNWFKNFSGF